MPFSKVFFLLLKTYSGHFLSHCEIQKMGHSEIMGIVSHQSFTHNNLLVQLVGESGSHFSPISYLWPYFQRVVIEREGFGIHQPKSLPQPLVKCLALEQMIKIRQNQALGFPEDANYPSSPIAPVTKSCLKINKFYFLN